MNRYVVGFMFNGKMDSVVMIRKKYPAWQSGLLNGVGGHILKLETVFNAMTREFKEETGMKTMAPSWAHVLTLRFPYAEVEFFAAKSDNAHDKAFTTTDEEIVRVSVADILSGQSGCVEDIAPIIILSKQRLVDREGVAP